MRSCSLFSNSLFISVGFGSVRCELVKFTFTFFWVIVLMSVKIYYDWVLILHHRIHIVRSSTFHYEILNYLPITNHHFAIWVKVKKVLIHLCKWIVIFCWSLVLLYFLLTWLLLLLRILSILSICSSILFSVFSFFTIWIIYFIFVRFALFSIIWLLVSNLWSSKLRSYFSLRSRFLFI